MVAHGEGDSAGKMPVQRCNVLEWHWLHDGRHLHTYKLHFDCDPSVTGTV